MVDCHIHSDFSPDSSEKIIDIVEHCKSKGITTIGISDHYDFRNPDLMFSQGIDLDSYLGNIDSMSGDVEIIKGIEIGYDPRDKKIISDITSRLDLDYSIFSVHSIFDKNLHDEMFFDKDNIYNQFNKYYGHIRDMVRDNDGFQILGHLDYPSRYKEYLDLEKMYSNNRQIICEILEMLIKKEKALEINGAGIRYNHKQPNPSRTIIKLYRDLGGKIITYGSDAHYKEYIGFGWDKVTEVLISEGFTSAWYFKEKTPIEYSLI